jgi:hypothetical protein
MAKAKPKPKQARNRGNILKKLKQIWETQDMINKILNKMK